MTDAAALAKDGSLPNDPDATNWVEEAGGLPPYIRKVAEDLHSERGMTVSQAIATAINKVKQWARGGGDTKPDTKTEAAAAVAQWEGMKVSKSADEMDDQQFADLLVLESEGYSVVRRGLNYMEKPHRFTPGPAGMCLFCSNSQRWHTENRPKTPAEVEQEKKDRSIQEKNDDALGSALMLTPLPTEDDMLAGKVEEQKKIDLAGKVAGAPVEDPNDPKVAAGVAKSYEEIFLSVLAKKVTEKKAESKSADRPLVEVQYDPEKKTGGINEQERKDLADDGIAMEDGTFPIRDEADLKTALKLWGKATDPHAARDHIIARAYDLDLLDSLPQNIKDYDESSKSGADKKGGTDEESDPTPKPSTASETSSSVAKHGTKGSPGYELLHGHRLSANDGPKTRRAKIRSLTRLLAKLTAMEDQGDVTSARHMTGPGATSPRGPQPGEYSSLYKTAAYAITKSSTDEKRYTLGPMYIPNRLDAHNEFTTAEELQKAVWDYVRTGDRAIRLQHNIDIVAGECVEVLSWPSEITADLALPGNGIRKSSPVTFPAGTTYMGIVWEPWAWEWVKKGKISGLSMGGFAKRVAVEFDSTVSKSVLDESVAKFSANQPRDHMGRWTESLTGGSSLSPTSLPQISGVVSGTRAPGDPFGTSTVRYTSSGAKITTMDYDPDRSSTTDTTSRSDVSALAIAVATLAAQAGVHLDHLLAALGGRVAKHGQKGEPNYPHRPGGSRRLGAMDDLLDTRPKAKPTSSGLNPEDPRVEHPAYGKHTERLDQIIEQLAASPGASKKIHTDASGNYTPERIALHNKIIRSYLDRYADTPRENKAIILAGASGAGKSSILRENFNITPEDSSQYAVINPDDIKDDLVEEGAVPAAYLEAGLNEGETASLIHEESSDISKRLQAALLAQGTNVVLDGTLSGRSSKQLAKVKAFKDAGYSVQGILVDGHLSHSLSNAATRHSNKASLDEIPKTGYKGRYVPFGHILGQAPDNKKSKIFPKREAHRTNNSENFESVIDAGLFDTWEIHNGYLGDDGQGAQKKARTASGAGSRVVSTRGY